MKVFIEVAAGSCDKNIYDAQTMEHKGTRRVARPYPYPYGFVLGTTAADGDGVDCYVITTDALTPGSVVECEPIGLLEQHEDGEVDHKVLAAVVGQDVDTGPELLKELRDFIVAVFAAFPDARVCVGGILPREAALHHIRGRRGA